MTKEEFFKLANKHARGQCTDEEKKTVESFYAKLQESNIQSDRLLSSEEELKGRILSGIFHRINTKEQVRTRYNYRRIAAAIIILVGVGVASYWSLVRQQSIALVTIETSNNQRKSVTLADGSHIVLNVDSKITYPEQFAADSRNITLYGEAFFQVSRDVLRPFVVHSGEIETKVLGTSFNINAYPDENINVTVASGKVQVYNGRETVNLIKNEQAYYRLASERFEKRTVEHSVFTEWKADKIKFDAIPFREALDILSRWYHVEIVVNQDPTVDDCIIKAAYKNEGLNNILTGLQNLVAFEFRKEGQSKIVVTNYGCKK